LRAKTKKGRNPSRSKKQTKPDKGPHAQGVTGAVGADLGVKKREKGGPRFERELRGSCEGERKERGGLLQARGRNIAGPGGQLHIVESPREKTLDHFGSNIQEGESLHNK